MAQSEQEKILAQMREAQAKQAEIVQKTGRAPKGGEVPQPQEQKPKQPTKPTISTDERVKQLEEQLKKAREDKSDLEEQLSNRNEYNSYNDDEIALSDIIKDNDEYHFTNSYEVETADGRKNKIFIKMHAPSVSEQAKIQNELIEMTEGRIQYYLADIRELFTAVAYFRVVGDNVPKWFTDIDNTYRIDIMFEVFGDYQTWLSRFLESRLQ